MFKRQYIYLLIFVLGMLAYQLVQDKLRIELRGVSSLLDYLLGVAPNFFAALALCSFFFYLTRFERIASKYQLAAALAVACVGLVSWEFAQILSSRGYFDWHDILWTFLGCVVFYGVSKWVDE